MQSQITLTLWTEEQLNKNAENNSVKNIRKLVIMKYIDWTMNIHEDSLRKWLLLKIIKIKWPNLTLKESFLKRKPNSGLPNGLFFE